VPFFAPEEHRDGELLLRAWRPGDGEELNRATVASYELLRRFMTWPSPDTTVGESERYVRQSRAHWLLGEEWGVAMWRCGEPSGWSPAPGSSSAAGRWSTASGRSACGCGSTRQAGGLGTRVLGAMVDWADADWPFHKLTWHCESGNLASARVAEKCGFRLEGRLRENGPAASGAGHQTTLLFGLVRGDARPWRSGG
jgi:RimJ/RimL family protein N-acetyltransferase